MVSLLFLEVVISCSIFGLSLLFGGPNSVEAKSAMFNRTAEAKYRLVYFDTQGRAEVSRWMFAYAAIDFQDIRVQNQDWPTLQKAVGQLPYLEIVGKTNLSQSNAIARFVARKAHLVGRDDIEAAQAG